MKTKIANQVTSFLFAPRGASWFPFHFMLITIVKKVRATAARHERRKHLLKLLLFIRVCVCLRLYVYVFVQIEIVKENKCNEDDAKNSIQHRTDQAQANNALLRTHSTLRLCYRHIAFSHATPQSRLHLRRGKIFTLLWVFCMSARRVQLNCSWVCCCCYCLHLVAVTKVFHLLLLLFWVIICSPACMLYYEIFL